MLKTLQSSEICIKIVCGFDLLSILPRRQPVGLKFTSEDISNKLHDFNFWHTKKDDTSSSEGIFWN